MLNILKGGVLQVSGIQCLLLPNQYNLATFQVESNLTSALLIQVCKEVDKFMQYGTHLSPYNTAAIT